MLKENEEEKIHIVLSFIDLVLVAQWNVGFCRILVIVNLFFAF